MSRTNFTLYHFLILPADALDVSDVTKSLWPLFHEETLRVIPFWDCAIVKRTLQGKTKPCYFFPDKGKCLWLFLRIDESYFHTNADEPPLRVVVTKDSQKPKLSFNFLKNSLKYGIKDLKTNRATK